MKPEEIFIRRSIAHARTLPFAEAVVYLRGMLLMCGDHELVGLVRETYTHLSHCDTQLELLAIGQLNLPLNKSK